jgi:protein tyrosine/serine phosphatase
MTVRRHDFEGSFNFRDLGGWRTEDDASVKWGRLFRADSVHLMTESDVLRARDQLRIRTVVDLRNDDEIAVGGVGTLASAAVRHHAPLSSRRGLNPIDAATVAANITIADRSPDTMASGYLLTLERSADLIVDVVDRFAADDALPGVFFCAAGKDRTGVMSAVILGAIGIRDADIIEDYVLTADSIEAIIGRFASAPGSPDLYRDYEAKHFAPYKETMEYVIAGVKDEWGSFADYLLKNGLPQASLDTLTTALLERL